jgi:protein-L-isoaspartate O-methyltransferase
MSTDDRLRRRARFDTVADLYDRVRPAYPPTLFTDLVELTGIGPGTRVLEIGCGTGQASVPLAELGADLVAMELGKRLAERASARLARFDSARVMVADFDAWHPGVECFDVIFAATAFHWLDPATRIDHTADLLVPGGALATVRTMHVAGGTESFFAEVQAYYRRFQPDWRPDPLLPADELPYDMELGSGRYGKPVFRRYETTIGYDTAEYLDLLRTYSTTLALSRPAAAGLLRGIGQLIDGRYGGRITKRYLTELRVARRVG